MLESIVRAMVVARRIATQHRAAFPQGNPQPGIYLNHPRLFREREKNLMHHFKVMHDHDIELHSFPQAKIAAGQYDRTGVDDNDIKLLAYVENYRGAQGRPSKVFVSDGLNFCHTRFYALKELIHLVTTTDDNVTVQAQDINALLDKLVNASMQGVGTAAADADAENAAYFGAIEILINRESVNEFLVENPDTDHESASEILSRKYLLPKKMVNYRLRNQDFFNFIYARPEFNELN